MAIKRRTADKNFTVKSKGFTLVELSLVMILMGILLAFLGNMLLSYLSQARLEKTQNQMEIIDTAIQDFLSLNGRYPCVAAYTAAPDTAGFGAEVSGGNPGSCANTTSFPGTFSVSGNTVIIGAVPTRELNLPDDFALDGWGNRYTYAITRAMTGENVDFSAVNGAVAVIDATGAAAINPPGQAHYVIISHGPDGKGAYTAQGGATGGCTAGTGQDVENCDRTDNIFRRSFRADAAGANFYDDLLTVRALAQFSFGVPAGGIMAFDLAGCPAGWTALANMTGRTLIGVGDPDGPLNYTLGDDFGTVLTPMNVTNAGPDSSVSTGPSPPDQIIPPSRAFLFCRKNG